MPEKYDLKKILEEIEADEYAGDPRSFRVSQDAIKKMIMNKKKPVSEKTDCGDKEP